MPLSGDGVRFAAIVGIVALAACRPAPDRLDRDGDGVTRVACLGDSNTFADPPPGWCDLLGETSPHWVMSNRSWNGMSIVDFGATYGGFVLAAAPHVDEVLSLDQADVVILAFGTNDLRQGATPQAIVEAYAQAKAKIERSGARCLIALTAPTHPPQPPELNDAIRALNARLQTAFPGDTVDFWSGMTPAEFKPDGLHVNVAGHAKRAAVAREALLR
jgi:lysophospholipase L1-like esterase